MHEAALGRRCSREIISVLDFEFEKLFFFSSCLLFLPVIIILLLTSPPCESEPHTMRVRKLCDHTSGCLHLQMWRSQTQSPSAAALTPSWSPVGKRSSPPQHQHQPFTTCQLPSPLTRATRSSPPHESYLARTPSSSRPRASLGLVAMAGHQQSSR